jgi:hypothetical protein
MNKYIYSFPLWPWSTLKNFSYIQDVKHRHVEKDQKKDMQ